MGCCVIAVIGLYTFEPEHSNRIETRMTDENMIAREWVEIREDSKDGTLVFRPADYPVPPARGRRHLMLAKEGRGQALDAGPTDRLESFGEGDWSIDGQILRLNISGWVGEYDIEDLQNNILVLQKR